MKVGHFVLDRLKKELLTPGLQKKFIVNINEKSLGIAFNAPYNNAQKKSIDL